MARRIRWNAHGWPQGVAASARLGVPRVSVEAGAADVRLAGPAVLRGPPWQPAGGPVRVDCTVQVVGVSAWGLMSRVDVSIKLGPTVPEVYYPTGVVGTTGLGTATGGVPGTTYPNEPVGFTRICEANYTVKPGTQGGVSQNQVAGYWWRAVEAAKEANMTVVADATAPTSPSAVLDVRFPNGFVAGEEPAFWIGWNDANLGESVSSLVYRELYLAFWLKIPAADYENQATGTKLFYLNYMHRGRMNHSILSLYNDLEYQTAQSSWPLRFWATVANTDGSDPGAAGYILTSTGRVTCNTWHFIELYMKQNTVTATPTADGQFKLWLNGNLEMNASNIKYTSAANPLGFHQYRGAPVYGGSGNTKTREDHLRFDHLYISGVV